MRANGRPVSGYLWRGKPDLIRLNYAIRRTWTEDARCGTRAGYLTHLRLGEIPCGPCTDAHGDYCCWYRIVNRPPLSTPRVRAFRARQREKESA